MRTLADTAPRCRGPAHDDDRGTDCDCFDQETLAIGTRPTTVKDVPARPTSRSSSSVIEYCLPRSPSGE
jgi:hypothetical protein